MKLELIGYPIIKNKVSPMLRTRSQTEALTFALSSKVERKDKGRKDLTASLTSVLSRKGREELKGCPLTLALSRGMERIDEGKFFLLQGK
jgi:ribosomal 30S subunit maturation factor RimM